MEIYEAGDVEPWGAYGYNLVCDSVFIPRTGTFVSLLLCSEAT